MLALASTWFFLATFSTAAWIYFLTCPARTTEEVDRDIRRAFVAIFVTGLCVANAVHAARRNDESPREADASPGLSVTY